MRKEYIYLWLCIWGTISMCSSDDQAESGEYEGDAKGECSDGADNDRDGLFDCDDEGCAGASNCLSLEADSTDTPSDSEKDSVNDSNENNEDTDTVDNFDTENICEKIELTAGAVPNRVMIIQDLSSSLKNHGRWDELKEAMTDVLNTFDNEIALGVVPFATTILDGEIRDADCTVNVEHVIPPEPGNGDAIYNLVYTIDSDDLVGGTPTGEALQVGRDVLVNEDPNNGSTRHMILVTDGLPNCVDGVGMGTGEQEDIDEVNENVQRFHDEDDIEIFVVGYSMDSSDMGNLDIWAELGGTQSAYPADDAASLVEQMSSISVGLVTCSYTLDAKVADPRYVRVQIDGTTLPYDEADGWSLGDDKVTVTFEGASCDLLKNGDEHNIDVAVECYYVVV